MSLAIREKRTIYDPARGDYVPLYECPVCQDRMNIIVPLLGEEWDMECLYIHGTAASIPCPFCLYPSDIDEICRGRARWNIQKRAIDYDFIELLGQFRRNELTPGMREELRQKMEEAKAKFLGMVAENSKRLRQWQPDAETMKTMREANQ